MRRVTSNRKDSFEHFYLTKVALGDCCGCAERVIDWRDIENASKAQKRAQKRHLGAVSEPMPSTVSRLVLFIKTNLSIYTKNTLQKGASINRVIRSPRSTQN